MNVNKKMRAFKKSLFSTVAKRRECIIMLDV